MGTVKPCLAAQQPASDIRLFFWRLPLQAAPNPAALLSHSLSTDSAPKRRRRRHRRRVNFTCAGCHGDGGSVVLHLRDPHRRSERGGEERREKKTPAAAATLFGEAPEKQKKQLHSGSLCKEKKKKQHHLVAARHINTSVNICKKLGTAEVRNRPS